MRDTRGTVILCDQLYLANGGKWVIAGTYSTIGVPPNQRHLDLTQGLNFYVRFQVERAGRFPCELLLVSRSLPANAPPISRQEFTVQVVDPLAPVEVGCHLPPFRVQGPSLAELPAQAPITLAMLVWLRVDGDDVASCPLNIVFQPAGTAADGTVGHHPGP